MKRFGKILGYIVLAIVSGAVVYGANPVGAAEAEGVAFSATPYSEPACDVGGPMWTISLENNSPYGVTVLDPPEEYIASGEARTMESPTDVELVIEWGGGQTETISVELPPYSCPEAAQAPPATEAQPQPEIGTAMSIVNEDVPPPPPPPATWEAEAQEELAMTGAPDWVFWGLGGALLLLSSGIFLTIGVKSANGQT